MALWQLTVNAAAPAVVDVLHLRRPRGLGRILAFCRGFGQGLRTPVDRTSLKYVLVPTPELSHLVSRPR